MKKKRMKSSLIVLIITLLVIMFPIAFNTRLVVNEYTVKTSKVNDNVRIMLITDLHGCDYGTGQYELINAIKEENPDVVLLGGDIVDECIPYDNAITLFESITKLYPCYYVSGNHEFWSGEIERIKDLFRNHNIIILEGDNQFIELNGQKINICGVDDVEIGEINYREQIKNSQDGIDLSLFTVFLAHRPEYIDLYLEYDFDLILSGHAHGGQWRIPYLINGLYSPDQGLFPKYAGGLYQFDHSSFIVSRGLAKESTKVPRIFNPPELVLINVEKE